MHKIIAVSALGLVLALASAGTAEARGWQRQSTVTGPRGGVTTHNGSGSCAGGSCSWHGTTTGPGGKTYTNQGSGSCSGGHCSSTGSVTGPKGGTVRRSGSSSYTPPN